MSDNYIYKKADSGDIELLVKTRLIVIRTVFKALDESLVPLLEKESRDYYISSIASDMHTAYIIYDEEKFIGAGGISYYRVMPTPNIPDGRKAYIMNMYTAPEYRRRGIGMKTLGLLVEDARSKGVGYISLEASPMGRPLYEKYGFVPDVNEMKYIPKY